MEIPWGIIISLAVLCFAFLIKQLISEIIEEKNIFLGIVIAFLFVYAAAAVAVNYLNPSILENYSVVQTDVISSL